MRTDGRRELRRPAGAVLRPLGMLVAAVASGFGMWHALMQDGQRPPREVETSQPAVARANP